MSDRSQFSPENMRARFHELGAKREALLAQIEPLRAERDRIVQEADAKAKDLVAQFKAIETEGVDGQSLFEIDMERGMLARALQGKTGAPPSE